MIDVRAGDPDAVPQPDISVVIGFKDWGTARLMLAVRSLLGSFGSVRGEVIVSDYGSTSCPEVKDQVEELGATYVYTSTDGVWSRSRALNAGFAVSRGKVLVSTDADMLFSPGSMEVVARRVLADPTEALALQCRDLPEGFDDALVEARGLDWEVFEDICTFRPRWGMGGMMAVARDIYLAIRGFDERMEIYGGEDLDFAQRVRRAGRRVSWLEHPEARMYHMWHPSTRAAVDLTPAGSAAIAYNRSIVVDDKSFVRNTTGWRHPPPDAPLLASVVITTRDRADYLAESIHSALAQTVRDLEVIVVDDGSSDHTEQVVKAIQDPRVRYFKRPARGIPAARNFAATVTRSAYTVIHDDDDLMMPDRVAHHFAGLHGGDAGTYGGWVDFRDSDGSIVAANPGKEFSFAALLFAGKVFAHATLMLETALIRAVGYDEQFRSGSDYNLALRLSRLGVSLRHTGHVHLVRRLHDGQVTLLDVGAQKGAAIRTLSNVLAAVPPGQRAALRQQVAELPALSVAGIEEPERLVQPYLPDRLVERDIEVENMAPGVPLDGSLGDRLRLVEMQDLLRGRSVLVGTRLRDASWADLAALRAAGCGFQLIDARARGEDASTEAPPAPSALAVSRSRDTVLGHVLDRLDDTPGTVHAVLSRSDGAVPDLEGVLVDHLRSLPKDASLEIKVFELAPRPALGPVLAELIQDPTLEVHLHHAGIEPGSEVFWRSVQELAR